MNFWKKHQTQLFLNTSPSTTATWARLGYSTQLAIDANPETEDYDFIKDENPSTIVTNNHPSLSQEIMCQEGDGCFEYIWSLFYGMGIGSDVETEILVVFPKAGTASSSFKAWKSDCSIILGSFDAVAKKITFDIKFNGDITEGTATVSEGTPSFTADTTSAE